MINRLYLILLFAILCLNYDLIFGSPYETVIVFDLHDVLLDKHNNAKHSTIAYAQKLYEKEYMLIAFSNISDKKFKHVQKKYPAFKVYFKEAYTYSAANNFTSKNSPEAFKKLLHNQLLPAFKNKYNSLPKNIVFVDDKQSNLHNAQEGLKQLQHDHTHLKSIHLKTVHYTNDAQLKLDLQPLPTP